MATREGNWWSRAWGAVALAAFAAYFGAAIYEAAVVAPLWSLDPPKSVEAWKAVTVRPDSSSLFEPLAVVVVVATMMAWISGLATRGWRRWWLTLAMVAAAAVAAVTLVLVLPAERELFGPGADEGNAATVVAWTGEWIRAAAMRLAALLVGMWSLGRAQLAGGSAYARRAAGSEAFTIGTDGPPVRVRRTREFSFGDDDRPEITLGDEAENPRERWRRSLPGNRRTAKK